MGKSLPSRQTFAPSLGGPASFALQNGLPAPTRLTCLAPVLGDREMLSLGVWASMGALFPPDPEEDQGGTGQRLGMSQVPHRPALSSSSSSSPPLPPPSLPPSPPMWPLPSHSHPDHRPSPGPLLRFLHCLGQCSCCGRWGSGWPWAVLRSKVSSQNDSALWSWVSVWVGPVLPAQLVWPWHPCPGSTLSGPCPGPVPSSPCAIQTQPNLDKWVAEWMD